MSTKNIKAVLKWAERGDAPEELAAALAEVEAIEKAARVLDKERVGLYVMGGEVDEAWGLMGTIAESAK